MAKATFTPGPWKLYSAKLRPEYPVKILEVQDTDGAAIVKWGGFDGCDQPKGQIAANARLCSAAPELFAALQSARRWLEPNRFNRHVIANIDRALKKAAVGGTEYVGEKA